MIWNPGKTLKNGRYTIEEILKHGRFSVTYLAKSEQGERVVIKTPDDAAIPRGDFDKLQERFRDEARRLTQCQRSSHIVKAYDAFQEDGFECIVTEYVAGSTLDKRNPLKLPESEAIGYVRQVGEALEAIHALNLIHRDVTPENIILRSNHGINEAVLIDFGLARDFQLSQSVTATQKISPFTARELCLSQHDRGPFTDLYGLGAVLYTLVTGEDPALAVDRVPGKALMFPAGVSGDVAHAIETAMALRGVDRPSTVAEWLEMLPKSQVLPTQPATQPTIQPTIQSPETQTTTRSNRQLTRAERITLGLTALGVLFAAFQGIPAFLSYFFPKDVPPVAVPTATPIAPSGSPTVSPKPK